MDFENNQIYKEVVAAGFSILRTGERYEVPYVEIRIPEGMAIYSICRKIPTLNKRFFEARDKIAYFNGANPFFYKDDGLSSNSMMVNTLKIPLDLSAQASVFPAVDENLKKFPKYIIIDLNKEFLALYYEGNLKRAYPISPGILNGASISVTPVFEFNVLQKVENYWSVTYDGWMPWALTINPPYYIHGGPLPGAPDSHGCIRLFTHHAKELFALVDVGTPGKIIDAKRPEAQELAKKTGSVSPYQKSPVEPLESNNQSEIFKEDIEVSSTPGWWVEDVTTLPGLAGLAKKRSGNKQESAAISKYKHEIKQDIKQEKKVPYSMNPSGNPSKRQADASGIRNPASQTVQKSKLFQADALLNSSPPYLDNDTEAQSETEEDEVEE
jgi:hypothetical protein